MAFRMSRLPRLLLILAALLLAGLTVVRAGQSWKYDSHLDHVAGVWIALALDLKHGLFYRAPFGPTGYGGTRFFPLYFCLHAAAMKIGGWRAAGYFLSATSVMSLLAGVYYLLRRLGIDCWLAAAGVLAVLAGSSVQDSLLGIREDGMAATFSVWGLAICAERDLSSRRVYLAAVFFVLAFATKESSVSGCAALVLWLLLSKHLRPAIKLLTGVALGYGMVLIAMFYASSGRAFAPLHWVLATGSSWSSLIKSPIGMEQMMHGYIAETIMLVLGLAALVATAARRVLSLPSCFFLCTLAVTLVIFSSEGTAGNHLIELHVAGVVMLAVWASELPEAGIAVLAAGCIMAWLELVVQHRDVDAVPVRAQLEEVARAIGPDNGPILADNPMVPIVAGQQPYLLDAFMFRAIREHDPAFAAPMWEMLREQRFAAVVLIDNPDSEEGSDTYSNYHFGDGFVSTMRERYQPAGAIGGQYLFLPRAAP